MSTLREFYGGYSPVKVSRKNLFINGSGRVNQRGQTNNNPVSNGDYLADRWKYAGSGGSFAAVVATAGAGGNVIGMKAVSGFTPASTDNIQILQKLERYDTALLRPGGSLTLSFNVYATVAGVYTVVFRTYDGTTYHRIVKEFTIDSALTWEYKSITIDVPANYFGTASSAEGFAVIIGTVGGSSRIVAADTWTTDSTSGVQTTDTVNWAASADNVLYFAKLQLEVGENASEFEQRHIEEEMALCQRYFYRYSATMRGYPTVSSTTATGRTLWVPHPVTMRAVPTLNNTYASWTPSTFAKTVGTLLEGPTTGATAVGSLTVYEADAEL